MELQESKDAGTQLKSALERVQMGIGPQNMDVCVEGSLEMLFRVWREQRGESDERK